MNEQKYRWLLYTIIVVIFCTIGIQVYWNYKNYLINKQQLINDVQGSLDKAVDNYYTLLAEQETVDFSLKTDDSTHFFNESNKFQEIISHIKETKRTHNIRDSIKVSVIEGINVYKGKKADSLLEKLEINISDHSQDFIIKKSFDPKKIDDIKMLTSKVVVSIVNDTIVLSKVDSLLNLELNRKNIYAKYNLSFKNASNSVTHFNRFRIVNSVDNKDNLKAISKSTFLPNNSELKISFTNETKTILKRILVGIVISSLLILIVIGCLFYLLKIIRQQKQLAEVKNDLISNITHEFKTPIATIGVAIESIKDFNVIENKEKTKTYLDMSNQQLSKLNLMVEKLLETATLDSDSLKLNKEPYNITELLLQITEKHKIQSGSKKIFLNNNLKNINAKIDVFHFENALNNIIDNAIKYGGDKIIVDLMENNSNIIISVSDNGNTLMKANKEKIFEKFYRVSKGNTHDIKGFGIGLYYTKKIVEKHNGSVNLDLKNNLTTFKISIPK